ncbi:MAG: DHA2 family efflux MFS transporter permease subunit [Candidatus Tectomicrobia bacterium]|uniref:DHA2 family efflux MFS transporter permease subunit n=1 Tax=Tectimicrobiota bacterium TaxID=2528274 RepID=A0A937VY27_UNCTE|nr:DHA2 family efflux MFS transporter permease subunit [Candidatus Tectomicrobia bacterium]
MSPPTASTSLQPRERWLATSSLLLGMVSFTIAIMVANVILPQLMTSLRADLDQAQWVLTGPGIAQTVSMPLVGWLASLTGHRMLYLASLALFCGGSVLSGLAWSIESLIAFQVVSGLGVGLMQPLIAAILYQIFPPNQRGLALGLSMVGWSFGPAVGPILGGYLVEWFNWRAAFYLCVPLGVVGFLSAWAFLPTLPRPGRKAMDQWGLLTLTVAMVTLSMALTQGRREGWDSGYITTLFTMGTIASVSFLGIEWRSASPLVDLRLFRYAAFTFASLVVLLSTAAFRGTGVLTIVFAQQVLDFTPLHVGWLLLTGNIAYGVTVIIAGRLADRLSPWVLTTVGLGVFAFAFYWFSDMNETVSEWAFILLLTLRLASYGIVGPPNNLSAMRSLPEDQVVMASGVFTLLRSIAGTLGSAVSVTIYEQRYFVQVQRYAEDNALQRWSLQEAIGTVQQALTSAGEAVSGLAVQSGVLLQQRLLAEATTIAYQDFFLLAALASLLAILPALPVQETWEAICRRRRQRAPLTAVPPAPAERPQEVSKT